jgi:ribosome maturation factor RimP
MEQQPAGAGGEMVLRLTDFLEPVVRSEGLVLVELTFQPEKQGLVLRLFVDRPQGGVTLDECQQVSRQVGDLLDVEDLVPEKYHLEVSSPGLTRRLKTRREYEIFAGRLASLVVTDDQGRSRKTTGVLKGLMGEEVLLEVNGKVQAIPLDRVAKANLEIEF